MLPDFPDVKKRAEKFFCKWAEDQIPGIAPTLGLASRFKQHEGSNWRLESNDRPPKMSGFKKFESEIVLKRDEMRKLDLSKTMELFRGIAKDMARQQSELMFKKIGEATEASAIHVEGELQPDHLLEALESKIIEFDPATGELSGGECIVMHPEVYRKIAPRIEQWNKDSELKRKMDDLMRRKKAEWHEREARRKLVD